MSKKILGIILAASLTMTFVACGEKNSADEKAKSKINIEQNTRSVGDNDKTKNLEGVWASKKFTHESFKEEGEKLSNKIKEQSDIYGLKYEVSEKIENVDGVEANVKSIYLDNENPEENKLESMGFKTQFLGASQEGGKFELKMSLKFNGEQAASDSNFNLGDTSIAKYAQVLTGEENRDYSQVNQKIMDIVKSSTPEGIIEDSINGLHEELAVSKDYIIYTLSTKEFVFEKEENSGI